MLFHSYSGCTKSPHSYIIRVLPGSFEMMDGFSACHRKPAPAKYESGNSTTLLKLIYNLFDIKILFACSICRHISSLLYSREETHPHVWLSPAYHRQTVHVVCFALTPVWKKITHTAPAGHGTVPPPVVLPQNPSHKFVTPWSRVLLEKLTGFQPVKKFPAFYGNRRFITAFTSARHLSLS